MIYFITIDVNFKRKMMTNKLFTIISIVILFLGCSQIDYKNMYDNQVNIFDAHAQTQSRNDQRSIQNSINPMKRPSYDEYIQY